MSALIPKTARKDNHPGKKPTPDQPPSKIIFRPLNDAEPRKAGLFRLIVSLAIAAIADGLNAADFSVPLIYIPVDIATVLMLLALWGMRRELLLALIPELIPALNVFPTWVAVVLYLHFRSAPQTGRSGRTHNSDPLQ